jgi:hypothetical protein
MPANWDYKEGGQMRRLTKIGTAALLAACVALAAAAGAEASTKLTLDQGAGHTALAPGEFFQVFQEEFGGQAIVIKFPLSTVECRNDHDHNAFLGTVLTNQAGKDEISLTEGGLEFCESCHYTAEGSIFLTPTRFPWTLAIKTTGTVKLGGATGVGFVGEFPDGRVCEYDKKALTGTTNPLPAMSEQSLALRFEEQQFRLNRATATRGCPLTAVLGMELQAGSNEGLVSDRIG